MLEKLLLFVIIAALLLFLVLVVKAICKAVAAVFGPVTVFEYQRGLRFVRGKLEQVLQPGKYWIYKPDVSVQLVDVRQWVLSVPHQEVLTADNVSVKVSCAAKVQIVDPLLSETKSTAFREDLYLTFHLMLRELISQVKADELLLQRNSLSEKLLSGCRADALAVGVHIESAGLKDITFPGELKKVFAQVVQAEKAGQAALTKSRAEIASLRALSNAARMLDSNPHLVTLRTLHAVSELAATSGNTIVFGCPPTPLLPLPVPPPGGKPLQSGHPPVAPGGDLDE